MSIIIIAMKRSPLFAHFYDLSTCLGWEFNTGHPDIFTDPTSLHYILPLHTSVEWGCAWGSLLRFCLGNSLRRRLLDSSPQAGRKIIDHIDSRTQLGTHCLRWYFISEYFTLLFARLFGRQQETLLRPQIAILRLQRIAKNFGPIGAGSD